MVTILINSGKSKTFDSHRILLNITNNVNLNQNDKYVALSNLSIYLISKNIKKSHIKQ